MLLTNETVVASTKDLNPANLMDFKRMKSSQLLGVDKTNRNKTLLSLLERLKSTLSYFWQKNLKPAQKSGN